MTLPAEITWRRLLQPTPFQIPTYWMWLFSCETVSPQGPSSTWKSSRCVQTPAWSFRIHFLMVFLESNCSQQSTRLHLFLHILILLMCWFMSCGSRKNFGAQEATNEHLNWKKRWQNTVSELRSAAENKALSDVKWHVFASVLVPIWLWAKGVVCWYFWNERFINNKVAQAATEMRKLTTMRKEWLAKRSTHGERSAWREVTFAASILIVCTASFYKMLQTKNIITENFKSRTVVDVQLVKMCLY